MPKAIWNNAILADSDDIVKLEGNYYFPPDSINQNYLHKTDQTSICPWKGIATYYDIEVDGQMNAGAAWSYENPSPEARQIAGHIAFWRGVKIEGATGLIQKVRNLFS